MPCVSHVETTDNKSSIVSSGFMTRGQVKGSVEDGGLTVHHVPVQKTERSL